MTALKTVGINLITKRTKIKIFMFLEFNNIAMKMRNYIPQNGLPKIWKFYLPFITHTDHSGHLFIYQFQPSKYALSQKQSSNQEQILWDPEKTYQKRNGVLQSTNTLSFYNI